VAPRGPAGAAMYNEDNLCYKLSVRADAVLNLRVPASIKEALAKASEENLRTLSSMATWAIAEWLAEHGYLDRESRSTPAKTNRRGR
jgi:hypothetical protein